MGILGLSRLIADIAPEAIREVELKSLFGRRIAIDASMSIYQFLIAIRNRDQLMTNESGETTSHLIGLFYRTIKLLEMGIKPIYVFDGKAPKLKGGELTKRAERRREAETKLADAIEEQDVENISKFNKRVVRVTRQHNSDCKKLLKLLGLPVIESPSEAEAQCAQLCKEGLVYATATEDMDGLTFGSPRLVRNMTSSNNEKVKEYYLDKVLDGLGLTHQQFIDLGILMGCDYCDSIKGIGGKKGLELIKQYGSIEQILEKKFGITEFTDVEIDYGDRRSQMDVVVEVKEEDEDKQEICQEVKEEIEQKEVNGEEKCEETKQNEDTQQVSENGDKNEEDLNDSEIADEAHELSDSETQTQDPEEIDSSEDAKGKKSKKKSKKVMNPVPENWLFIGARKLFVEPNVLKGSLTEADLKQKDFDEEGIVQFLCADNGFSEDRVRNALKRVKEAKGKTSQTRIDTFFKSMPTVKSDVKNVKSKDKNDKKNGKRSTPQSKNASKRGRR